MFASIKAFLCTLLQPALGWSAVHQHDSLIPLLFPALMFGIPAAFAALTVMVIFFMKNQNPESMSWYDLAEKRANADRMFITSVVAFLLVGVIMFVWAAFVYSADGAGVTKSASQLIDLWDLVLKVAGNLLISISVFAFVFAMKVRFIYGWEEKDDARGHA